MTGRDDETGRGNRCSHCSAPRARPTLEALEGVVADRSVPERDAGLGDYVPKREKGVVVGVCICRLR